MNTLKTRRDFMKLSAAATAGAFVLPRFSIGKPGGSANSKLNIAMIGAGGIARLAYNGCADENIVALCDIDERQFPADMAGIPTFSDFRVMLDKMGKDIDGVCINTPDHTHFVATIDAMQRGIHVCTQKPLTHNIWQARTLRKAKHKYGVVTNMGNQGHASSGIRTMREWYDAGVLGQVREVHLGHRGPDWKSRFFHKPASMPLPAQPIPSGVNWDQWIGPAQMVDYNRAYHPATWRGFNDFGTGQFGDFFCHTGDGPVWTLDLYEPTVIECVERAPGLEGMIPEHSIVRFDFPARGNKVACSMYWYDGLVNGGTPIKRPDEWDMGDFDGGAYWYGDKQNVYTDIRSGNPRLSTRAAAMEFKKNTVIDPTFARVEGGPHKEWVNAIKGGAEPGSNFDYAAPLTEVGLLGVLAQRFGGRIDWDAKQMRITNRPELNAYLKEPVRSGWEYGDDLWK